MPVCAGAAVEPRPAGVTGRALRGQGQPVRAVRLVLLLPAQAPNTDRGHGNSSVAILPFTHAAGAAGTRARPRPLSPLVSKTIGRKNGMNILRRLGKEAFVHSVQHKTPVNIYLHAFMQAPTYFNGGVPAAVRHAAHRRFSSRKRRETARRILPERSLQ